MTERDKPIMPLFVFERRRDIELEAGFVLAGQLIIDIPKRPKPKRCHALLVERIVGELCARARERSLPDGLVIGWRDGPKPPNAVNVGDDAIMAAWAQRSVVVGVWVGPRNDGFLDRQRRRQVDGARSVSPMSKKRPSPAEARWRLNHRRRRELAKWRNEEAIGDPLGFAAAGRRVRAAGEGDPGLWRRKRDNRRWVKPNAGAPASPRATKKAAAERPTLQRPIKRRSRKNQRQRR
jgi:hypothetical protein